VTQGAVFAALCAAGQARLVQEKVETTLWA